MEKFEAASSPQLPQLLESSDVEYGTPPPGFFCFRFTRHFIFPLVFPFSFGFAFALTFPLFTFSFSFLGTVGPVFWSVRAVPPALISHWAGPSALP